MIYLDTSALVKLLVEEDHSLDVRKAVAGKAVGTATITFVEVLSALSRKDELDEDERIEATRAFLASWRGVRAVQTDRVLETAGVLTRGHRLRALDAIHLAAALGLGTPAATLFAVFDRELARAARSEGFRILTDPRFEGDWT